MELHMHSLAVSDIDAFRSRMTGALFVPGSADYETARPLWNGMIDKHPALIARCANTEDVVIALAFAREHGLDIAVRGGGHNVAGMASSDGGLVIDLSEMKAVRVDPGSRRVVAEGGVTIGDLDAATQAYHLAVPMGVVTETGIAGLTLGGGYGWQTRKHGLSCDALRAAEVVTADGRVLRASADENADLFWALRGGGGNCGVVTAFEYEAYPLGPDVFGLAVFYPVEAARTVLGHVRDLGPDLPESLSPIGVLGHIPEAEFFPVEHWGKPFVALVGAWIGTVEEGEQALASLRTLAEPMADLSGPLPFLEMQQFFDEDYPTGGHYYWKSTRLAVLSDAAIDDLVTLNAEAPSAHSTLDVWFTDGGAASRVPADATAFGDRSAPYMIGIEANWHDAATDEANVAWARHCAVALESYSTGGSYLNFPGFAEDGEAAVRAALGASYDRLRAIKKQYDPDNVFHTHQNVTPILEPV